MAYTVRGILQARILEWAAIPSSRGSGKARAKETEFRDVPRDTRGSGQVQGSCSTAAVKTTPSSRGTWAFPEYRAARRQKLETHQDRKIPPKAWEARDTTADRGDASEQKHGPSASQTGKQGGPESRRVFEAHTELQAPKAA